MTPADIDRVFGRGRLRMAPSSAPQEKASAAPHEVPSSASPAARRAVDEAAVPAPRALRRLQNCIRRCRLSFDRIVFRRRRPSARAVAEYRIDGVSSARSDDEAGREPWVAIRTRDHRTDRQGDAEGRVPRPRRSRNRRADRHCAGEVAIGLA